MTDEKLILKWNGLKNRQYNHEKVSQSDIDAFSNKVHESYIAGDITQREFLKYAEIVSYLHDLEESREEYENNSKNV
ncbi:MAG: hypothetical protein K6E68_05970 [Lachnospiraceae bacterium]|nr:hypothetical protein [Lachnospiraceae bacterium]